MTLVDFIDLSDHDIIELSSDDETVQEDQIATQHQATLLDRQAMLVVAGEGSQDVQDVFVAASEGSQDMFVAANEGRHEAAECGHGLEATTSSLVTEKAPLVAASEESQNVQAALVAASEGSQDVPAAFIAASEGSQAVQAEFVAASEGSQNVQVVLVAASEGRREAADSGNVLEATSSSLVTEKAPLDTTESQNCTCSPTSAPFPSPTSTTPKALTSEGGDTKVASGKVKRSRKNYHTGAPRTSPGIEPKRECHNGHVEELPAEGPTSEGGNAKLVRGKVKHPRKNYHTSTPRTSPRFEPKRECHNGHVEELPAEAPTSEGGDAKLVRGKVKHPRKDYHTGTPMTSPRFEPKRECHTGPVEELPVESPTFDGNVKLVREEVKRPRKNHHTSTPRTSPRLEPKCERNRPLEELPAEVLTSDGADAELVRGKMKFPRKNYHTGTSRTSPRFEPKRECRNGPVEELPAKALTSECSETELVRVKVEHSRKNYHTDTPRRSPRFEPKQERRNGPVEEFPADHKRFRTIEELIASPDTA